MTSFLTKSRMTIHNAYRIAVINRERNAEIAYRARAFVAQSGCVISNVLLAVNLPFPRFQNLVLSREPLNRVATLSRHTQLFVALEKRPLQISLITRNAALSKI